MVKYVGGLSSGMTLRFDRRKVGSIPTPSATKGAKMTKFNELEQKIMSCWSVCEDIQELRSIRDTRQLTEDELDNYLLGLVALYQIKFENLFSLYEQLLKERAAMLKSGMNLP